MHGLLFHDLRRSGARNYRRAGVAEDVIQRIGCRKTASMSKRDNIVDERDLAQARERLATFLSDAANAEPTIVPLADARTARHAKEHGQNTDNPGSSGVAPAIKAGVGS
jgi:hypothetical protein